MIDLLKTARWSAALCMFLFPCQLGAQDYPRLPMTSEWRQVEGTDKQGYVTARKYSLVIDTPDNPIRNTLLFQCSLSKAEASYLTFVIPKEIDLQNLYGMKEIPAKSYNVTVLRDGEAQEFALVGHVKGNEIFFDYVGHFKRAISELIKADSIKIHLDGDRMPIEFFKFSSEQKLPWEGQDFTFDGFAELMINRSGASTRLLPVEFLSETCWDFIRP